MELGPSGFPFEKYIGAILHYQGHNVRIGEIVQGKCVDHEVDVIAKTDHTQLMVECKYHNLPGTICDVKVPLYIQSRFLDVAAEWTRLQGKEVLTYQGCVVTNTRFSDDAIKYGTCAGLKLIGWDYPSRGSLRDQIDSLGLYPITCLTSLTRSEKQYLLDKKIVLCHELNNNRKVLEDMGIRSASRIETILQETEQLCRHLNKSGKPPGSLPEKSAK